MFKQDLPTLQGHPLVLVTVKQRFGLEPKQRPQHRQTIVCDRAVAAVGCLRVLRRRKFMADDARSLSWPALAAFRLPAQGGQGARGNWAAQLLWHCLHGCRSGQPRWGKAEVAAVVGWTPADGHTWQGGSGQWGAMRPRGRRCGMCRVSQRRFVCATAQLDLCCPTGTVVRRSPAADGGPR